MEPIYWVCIALLGAAAIFGLVAAFRRPVLAEHKEIVELAISFGLTYQQRDRSDVSIAGRQFLTVPEESHASAANVLLGSAGDINLAFFDYLYEDEFSLKKEVRVKAKWTLDDAARNPQRICRTFMALVQWNLPHVILRPRPIRPWPFNLITSPEERDADRKHFRFGRVYEAEGPDADRSDEALTPEIQDYLCGYPAWDIEIAPHGVAFWPKGPWTLKYYEQVFKFLPGLVKLLKRAERCS